MAKDKKDKIPLKVVRKRSVSIEDGCPVIVFHRRRGFLTDLDVKDTKDTLHKPVFRTDGKAALVALTDRLRAHLDAKELPTDKWPITPIELDYGYVPEEHGIVADEDLWLELAEADTEPLTEDRLSAELLHATNRILARFDEDELSDIFRAMHLYHLHSAVGELNELALVGETSKKARARGPQVKSERARTLRKLILATAQEFWGRHPQFKGQPWNTAKKIVDAVNEARERQHPGCEPLAYRTISNHIRNALDEAEQES